MAKCQVMSATHQVETLHYISVIAGNVAMENVLQYSNTIDNVLAIEASVSASHRRNCWGLEASGSPEDVNHTSVCLKRAFLLPDFINMSFVDSSITSRHLKLETCTEQVPFSFEMAMKLSSVKDQRAHNIETDRIQFSATCALP